MSLAGHEPKFGSRHICLIIAGLRGPVQYKGDEGANDAARPPEECSAEAGSPWPQVCHGALTVQHECQTVR